MVECVACEECDWVKWYYGRCNGCGNCFNKDDWIFQRTLWEEKYSTQTNIELYFENDGYNHNGNGVCFECVNEFCESPK